jgi:hypothetical protein
LAAVIIEARVRLTVVTGQHPERIKQFHGF